jgi:citrate lyase beta subunit
MPGDMMMRSFLLSEAISDRIPVATADWLFIDLTRSSEMIAIQSESVESLGKEQIGLAALLPPIASPRMEESLAAASRLGAIMVILCGTEGCADIQRLDMLLRLEEARLGLADGSTGIAALLNAGGVLQARNMHQWSRRLRAVGLDPEETAFSAESETASFARAQIALAAKAAGIAAIGTGRPARSEDFQAQCIAARENGFSGTFVRDLKQVDIANAIFQ